MDMQIIGHEVPRTQRVSTGERWRPKGEKLAEPCRIVSVDVAGVVGLAVGDHACATHYLTIEALHDSWERVSEN